LIIGEFFMEGLPLQGKEEYVVVIVSAYYITAEI
jgi:hypothetical protein